jgi:hypothetical protein
MAMPGRAEPPGRLLGAGEHGVPVPQVFDATGPDIVMEKVDGPTMLADVARCPWRLFRHAEILARVHRQVHAAPGPDWLRAPFGYGDTLLHLDLHPINVLLSPRGPVVIDWQGAGRGLAGGRPRPTSPSAGCSLRCRRSLVQSGSGPSAGRARGCSPTPCSGTPGCAWTTRGWRRPTVSGWRTRTRSRPRRSGWAA